MIFQRGATMSEIWDIVDQYGNKTGRLHQRGNPMNKGDYHLSVSVWIINDAGQILISQRAPTQLVATNMWEITGGSAITGENSLSAALRETKEELGIDLHPENGRLFKCYTYPHSSGDGAAYIEVWVFHQDVDISTVVLQPCETCNAIWANKEPIMQMIVDGKFINFSYIDDLFDYVENCVIHKMA